jgi:cold shock protein
MQPYRLWKPTMARGMVKWFNSQKGYGLSSGGGKDIFVHISAAEKAGLAGLNEGQTIEYEEVSKSRQNLGGKSQSLAVSKVQPGQALEPSCD